MGFAQLTAVQGRNCLFPLYVCVFWEEGGRGRSESKNVDLKQRRHHTAASALALPPPPVVSRFQPPSAPDLEPAPKTAPAIYHRPPPPPPSVPRGRGCGLVYDRGLAGGVAKGVVGACVAGGLSVAGGVTGGWWGIMARGMARGVALSGAWLGALPTAWLESLVGSCRGRGGGKVKGSGGGISGGRPQGVAAAALPASPGVAGWGSKRSKDLRLPPPAAPSPSPPFMSPDPTRSRPPLEIASSPPSPQPETRSSHRSTLARIAAPRPHRPCTLSQLLPPSLFQPKYSKRHQYLLWRRTRQHHCSLGTALLSLRPVPCFRRLCPIYPTGLAMTLSSLP